MISPDSKVMKSVFFLIVSFVFSIGVHAAEQTICPIMVDCEIDEEEVVEFEGTVIYMCCGSCISAWERNPIYYLKVGIDLGLIPQFEKPSDELQKKLDKVELLEQRFCPLRPENVISPQSPFVDYKGKRIYFYRDRDIDRRWIGDPDGAFETAREAGLLPQFD